MEREVIKEILHREGYPEFMIEPTIDKVEKFAEVVAKSFNEWCANNTKPNLEVEGFSFNDLVTKWGMKPIGAFITLDWLLRDPEKAKNSLRRGIR